METFLLFVLFAAPVNPPAPHLSAAQPPLTDLARFPSRNEAGDGLQRCEDRIAWIAEQMLFDPLHADDWTPWMTDARLQSYCWDDLAQAHDGACNDRWRLAHMRNLRHRLGPEDYGKGRMPVMFPPMIRRVPRPCPTPICL